MDDRQNAEKAATTPVNVVNPIDNKPKPKGLEPKDLVLPDKLAPRPRVFIECADDDEERFYRLSVSELYIKCDSQQQEIGVKHRKIKQLQKELEKSQALCSALQRGHPEPFVGDEIRKVQLLRGTGEYCARDPRHFRRGARTGDRGRRGQPWRSMPRAAPVYAPSAPVFGSGRFPSGYFRASDQLRRMAESEQPHSDELQAPRD